MPPRRLPLYLKTRIATKRGSGIRKIRGIIYGIKSIL